jgi:sec-independent protein translocase protein TatB
MFDIGFSEIVVIAVVALIVIGPEKLPKTARTLGHLFGRLQRYVNDVKADISREIELEELKKLQQEVQTAARGIETSVSAAVRDVETGVRTVESDLNLAGAMQSPASAAEAPVAPQTAELLPPLAEPVVESSPPAQLPKPTEPARQASLPGFDRG